jgi:hypothetical protein
VIDILPPEKLAPSPPKKHGKIALNDMSRRKSPDTPFKTDREYAEPDVVEEIFEDALRCFLNGKILKCNKLYSLAFFYLFFV